LGQYLAYLPCLLALESFRRLPLGAATRLLDLLAALTYYVDARHRHIARVNLCIAFPELSQREHDRIAMRSFQHTAQNLLYVSRLPLLNRENIASLVTYDADAGFKNFEAAKARGRGILYLTGHFSAWELLPAAHALYGHPLHFVTRPLDNPHLERYLRSRRESGGNRVIAKKRSARKVLERLKSKDSVGILMDQNTGLQEGVFANFFGLPAATTTAAALLALRADATILPGFLSPRDAGRYTINFLPPVQLLRTGEMRRDVQANTELFNSIIEGIVRRQPESWLWGHKRWKLQPSGNPQDLYSLSWEDLRAFLESHQIRRPELIQ
jgi:KDO2-lipid IV(A) lauroyltransferase